MLLTGVSALYAQQDPDDPGIQDSLIIDVPDNHVDSSSSYQFRFVNINAVTDDSVIGLFLPVKWHTPLGGVTIGPGTVFSWPLNNWDHSDTVILSLNYVRILAVACSMGPPECDPLFTNGQRLQIIALRLIIAPNAHSQLIVFDTTYDDRLGEVVFTDELGEIEITPAIQRGYLSVGSVGIGNDKGLPESFTLAQNYPNPFNASTAIEFSLSAESDIELTIYDILGRNVLTLVSGRFEAGNHSIVWDGTDYSGRETQSGVYFYAFRAEGQIAINKMIMIK
jgi:hypothetical protein